MRTGARLRSDDRGVSATVTHALALGITAILISGLLLSAGTMLLDQREDSAREQLRTVGNRIAGDLARAATLAQDGGNVTIDSRQPGSIAGRNYRVTYLTGSDCDTDLFTTDACLRLTLQGGQPSVMVPIRNETAVELEVRSRGRYTVSALANDSAERPPPPVTKRNLKVGIGNTSGEYGDLQDVNLTNRDPIAGFTFTPGTPTTLSVIQFRNDTEDLDGVIESYEWNFNDDVDDTIDATGRTVNHSYSSPGKYTVTLTVTDDDGETDSVSKVVSVGGVVYRGNLVTVNTTSTIAEGGLRFEIENLHGSEVEIQQVLVDPANDSIDYMDDEGADNEVEIDGDVRTGYYADPQPILDGGSVFDLDDGFSSADVARLSSGNNADVTFKGFDTDTGGSAKAEMASEPVFVAMRYEVGGSFYTAQFTLNGGVPTNDAPDADFTYSCTGMTCEFTDASSPNGGSIDSWEWNFDHDNQTASGVGPHFHTFPENETYQVSLTVNESGVTSTKTKAITFTNYSDPVLLAVNAGGPEVEVGGITYEGDTDGQPHPGLFKPFFSDSTVDSTTDQIGGTTDDVLYRTVRYGDESYGWSGDPAAFGYSVEAPNGEYEITFKFAEILDSDLIEETSPGDREFDVNVEGSTAIDDLDVYENVSAVDQALTVTTTGEVDDGTLTVEFEPESNDEPPMVSAVVGRLVDADAFQWYSSGWSSDGYVMEAESYHTRESGTDADGVDMAEDLWESTDSWDDAEDDASGGDAMEVQVDDNGDSSGDTTNGPRLDYYVDVDGGETGTYYVWVRMRCDGLQDEGVHVGLDGQPATYGANGLNGTDTTACHDEYDDWMWASEVGGERATVQINSAGQHTVNVWAYRDGVQIDKVVLTTDASYTPSGHGPSESTVG